MSKPLISIIVPIYNVEKYLPKCIESIIGQTYKDLEIFLVDDGSTDSSGIICDRYKAKDKRIHVLHKKNGGLSDARNVAIDIATGQYVFFVDGDDYINRKTIASLYENASKTGADIVTTDYVALFEYESPKYERPTNSVVVLNTQDALENLMYQKDVKTSAWGKLYKSELFSGIRYPKGKICEDLPTTYLLFAKAKLICLTKTKMYYYLQRSNSILNSNFNVGRMDALDFAEHETSFIQKKYPSIVKSAICREFMEAIYILIKLNGDTMLYHSEYLKVSNSIKKNRRIVFFDRKAPKKFRFCALLCCIDIRLAQNILSKRHNKKGVNERIVQ